GGEPDAAGPAETPEIGDPRHDDVVRPVLRLEDDDPRAVLVQRALELVGRRRRDEAADHLPALEPDLDPHAIVSHAKPPPKGRLEQNPDARSRPGARTGPRAARSRSARLLAPRGPRAPSARRRLRRRCGAS